MPVWQNRATFRRLGVWIHWWRRSNSRTFELEVYLKIYRYL